MILLLSKTYSKMTKSIELRTVKGTRDIDPDRKALQNSVVDTVREVYERYGYQPLESPVMEMMDILTAKFAAGEGSDVMKEIFKVTDQGERDIGLRFDMTVPMCRYVAQNTMIKLPFKRYTIGRLYRDGPIKLGRYREFWQADADIVGVPGPIADAEGLLMAAEIFEKLDLDVTFSMSSRELLYEIMEEVGVSKELQSKAIIALDKLSKIGEEGVSQEMKTAGLQEKQITGILSLVDISGDNSERIEALREKIPNSNSLSRLSETLDLLAGVPNLVFDPSLARGLGYYTGFFFECTLNDSKISSSLVGTGRYDNMIGDYLDGKEQIPAVGMSIGVSVVVDALIEKGDSRRPVKTLVYVVAISENEVPEMIRVATLLRDKGVATDMDYSLRKMNKNFSYADSLDIPYVMVIGENEVKSKTVVVKDMRSGNQKEICLDELDSFVSGLRESAC
jgi:histidyl-tRNA synthetase